MDAADARRDLLPGMPPQTKEWKISRVKTIGIILSPDESSKLNLQQIYVKNFGAEAHNWNIRPIVGTPAENTAFIISSPLTPPAASSVGYPDSPTYLITNFHQGSHSARPVSLGVSNGHIMKKHNSGSGVGLMLHSNEKIFSMLELHSDNLQRSDVPTCFDRLDQVRLAIQWVKIKELACHLTGGLAVAPVTSGGKGITKIIYRIFPVLEGNGKTSAPASIPKCHEYIAIVIDPLWMVDSGASASLTGNLSLLQGTHAAQPMNFVVANGQLVPSDTCGRAFGRVNLSGIRYAPGCQKNIISATHLVRLGCEVIFDDQGCTIKRNGTLVGKAPRHTDTDGLYYLDYLNGTQLGSICHVCAHPGAQAN